MYIPTFTRQPTHTNTQTIRNTSCILYTQQTRACARNMESSHSQSNKVPLAAFVYNARPTHKACCNKPHLMPNKTA